MKILQINAVYGLGSTGFYTKKLHEMLIENGDESYVICTKAEAGVHKNIIQLSSSFEKKINALYARVSGFQGHGAKSATDKIIDKIKEIKPDVILMGNLHSNFVNIKRLLEFIADNDIPLVVVLHDCWFFTGKCVHYSDADCMKWQNSCGNCPKLKQDIPSWYFDNTTQMLAEKAELFSKIKKLVVVGVSERITEDAKNSIVFSGRECVCIRNAIDGSIFYPAENPSNKEYKTVLGVSSRWSEFKGIDDFIYLSNYLKNNFEKPFKVVLAGDYRELSTEKMKAIKESGISMVGTKSSEELAELYREADAFVSASRAESFGCVLAEAVMCGTPVISYDGYAEREIAGVAGCGECVPMGNKELLAEATVNVLENDKRLYTKKLSEMAKKFGFNEYFIKFRKIFVLFSAIM